MGLTAPGLYMQTYKWLQGVIKTVTIVPTKFEERRFNDFQEGHLRDTLGLTAPGLYLQIYKWVQCVISMTMIFPTKFEG